ncbi:PaaI family thioesterase [Arenimonas oryziterrae]|uniref:Medium/long-chain acyl-CoA thioesterase YigI n=1 Tax=Arenimonas oryziterrae DSM 21050 = YC6267 TaxID=1121015 RepID=A0A091AYD9_9GAMM|nr:PaaI family thioesterase [Arenimonas oryziterrae]KFN43674.1 hypothetical protein N789_10380 [Arenimonas oryziterrae DSM 21050 = YC6267]
MTDAHAPAADFADRVRACFDLQPAMHLIGAELTRVDAGEVEIAMAHRDTLTQQHGFIHAGIVTTLVDSACGFAALSLMPAGSDVLSVEFKLNLLRPAAGTRFRAVGTVLKPGRTLMITRGDIFADQEGTSVLVATMLATMIRR